MFILILWPINTACSPDSSKCHRIKVTHKKWAWTQRTKEAQPWAWTRGDRGFPVHLCSKKLRCPNTCRTASSAALFLAFFFFLGKWSIKQKTLIISILVEKLHTHALGTFEFCRQYLSKNTIFKYEQSEDCSAALASTLLIVITDVMIWCLQTHHKPRAGNLQWEPDTNLHGYNSSLRIIFGTNFCLLVSVNEKRCRQSSVSVRVHWLESWQY